MMSAITTQVFDTARGRPACGLPVTLEIQAADASWRQLGHGITDADGRAPGLLPEGMPLVIGTYRLLFETAAYFVANRVEGFFPRVTVLFEVRDPGRAYHVPLLLSPHGYSTYRGSQ